MILEYGGPNKSSMLLSLAPKLDGLPPLHFLYVTVDGEGLPNALVEDNHTDQDLKTTLVITNHSFAVKLIKFCLGIFVSISVMLFITLLFANKHTCMLLIFCIGCFPLLLIFV